MKLWKPKFFENSRLPGILSKVAPINIWAISFGTFVWCKGALSETDKRHETIHYQQQLELLFVFQWVLYFVFYLVGLAKYRNGLLAYINNPFEVEAYDNEKNEDYLLVRKRYSWLFKSVGTK
jgi:hypothetical protein